jgi:tetratricopeptide (TPR) repeat protein
MNDLGTLGTPKFEWDLVWESKELRGDYRGIVQELTPLLGREVSLESARAWAALARARAFTGQREDALLILNALTPESLDLESQTIVLLTRAQIARTEGQWELAQKLAEQALEITLKILNPALRGDAQFALAMASAELDRTYLALDLFQQIRADSTISSYRRGLAALNEAWILWDLGRADLLVQLENQVPEGFRHRLQLIMRMREADWTEVQRIATSPALASIPVGEQFLIARYLLEASLVMGKSVFASQPVPEWVSAALEPSLKTPNGLQTQIATKVANFFGLKIAFSPQQGRTTGVETSPDWRKQLNLMFIDCMQLATQDPEGARFVWLNRINPILERHRYRSPVYPGLLDGEFSPRSPWSDAVSARIGIQVKAPVESEKKVSLHGSILTYHDKKVDLTKSPVSVRLLEILAGRRGQKVSKEYIHKQLTGNKYLPSKHDSRMHKLIGRLKKRLEDQQIPELWSLPGDNHVVLKETIEVV